MKAGLILLSGLLLGCLLMPSISGITGTSGTPGVIHFPEVSNSDWVVSIKSVCIQVEQSYTGLSGHSEPIAEELQGILSRIGVEVTVGEGAGCEATLSITIQVKPVAKHYSGATSDCYTGAETTGEAKLSAAGHNTLKLSLSYTIHGGQVITKCPTSPDQAPLEAAWTRAVMPMLREWWGGPALVSALKADSSVVRSTATDELKQMGPEASAALPVLVEMLGDDDPATRAAAANMLGEFGPTAAEAVPALVEAINDTDSWVRHNAITALGKIGDSQALPALVKALHHSDSYTRYVAAEALGKLGPKAAPAIPDLIETINDEFSQAGWAAVTSLGQIGPEADEAIPVLIKLLEGEDWSYKHYAASALKSITGQNFGEDAAAWQKWWEAQP